MSNKTICTLFLWESSASQQEDFLNTESGGILLFKGEKLASYKSQQSLPLSIKIANQAPFGHLKFLCPLKCSSLFFFFFLPLTAQIVFFYKTKKYMIVKKTYTRTLLTHPFGLIQ